MQGLLASRIDRQSGEHKHLLQTLSVIGRESSFGLIKQVDSHAEAPNWRGMLSDLRAGEFIYEQPVATGVEYIFKHALTQEVAYNSLLMERRKKLHERRRACAGVAVRRAVGRSSRLNWPITIATAITSSKAVEYLGRAGQQALRRSAYADAIGGLNAAIDLLQRLPDGPERIHREMDLQLAAWVSVNPG